MEDAFVIAHSDPQAIIKALRNMIEKWTQFGEISDHCIGITSGCLQLPIWGLW
jgi:hypothetical protein